MPGESTAPANLGELETAVMRVLWERDEATVNDVLESVEWSRPLAYTTVMTVLSRLTEKGFASREKRGRTFVYTAAVKQSGAASSALGRVIDRFFGGARAEAIAHLLSTDEDIDESDLAEMEEMIRRRREGR